MTLAVQGKENKRKTPTISEIFESKKNLIQAALPKVGLTADRLIRIAMTEMRQTPKLESCDPLSFLGAIIKCAQLGLEPGSALGQAYLIPFENRKAGYTECQVIIGYRGYISLARRSGMVVSISCHLVYEKDFFERELGFNEDIKHKPADGDRGDIIGCYAVAKLKDGGLQAEYMSVFEIEKIRDNYSKNNQAWKTNFDEMARKTVIRRLFKYLPVSTDNMALMSDALNADSAENQANHQVIDMNYLPEPVYSGEQTTIREIHAESDSDGKTEKRKLILEKISEQWKKMISEGWKHEGIERALGVKSDNIETHDDKRLIAIHQILLQLKKKE